MEDEGDPFERLANDPSAYRQKTGPKVAERHVIRGRTQIRLRLTPALIDQLEKLAVEQNRTFNQLCEFLLQQGIKSHER